MSDTKWRKLFGALRDAGVWRVRWKFVHDERTFEGSIPEERNLLADRFGDVLPYPYGAYQEIEWVEVGGANTAGIGADVLQRQGHFPIESTSDGLRIIGYSW